MDRSIAIHPDQLGNLVVEDRRITKGCQPHGLAFIVVGAESAELRYGFVERAERIREEALVETADRITFAIAEKRGRPLAGTIQRKQRGLFVGGHIETAGNVGHMVRHPVDGGPGTGVGPRAVEPAPEAFLAGARGQQLMLEKRLRPAQVFQGISHLCPAVERWIDRYRYGVDVLRLQAANLQTALDRANRKGRRMFFAGKPLLFNRHHQPTVHDDTCGGIMEKIVQAEYVHLQTSLQVISFSHDE